MNMYKRKPEEPFEAEQFKEHSGPDCVTYVPVGVERNSEGNGWITRTGPDTIATVSDGDYILKDNDGYFYPCSESVFKARFEEIE